MPSLDQFPIARAWPAQNPDIIQLYSIPTPNGVKVSIALEEMGLDYEPHFIPFGENGTGSEAFATLNPNGKIPAIIDPNGPGGKPIGLFESGAILVYLAEKTGKLIPTDPHDRYECLQWVFFQMGGIGPMFGQFGYFYKFAGKEIEDKRPLERYMNETKRLLGVLEQRLDGRAYILGDDYTIADIAIVGWVRGLATGYGAEEVLDLQSYANVVRWRDSILQRPAAERGLSVPKRPE